VHGFAKLAPEPGSIGLIDLDRPDPGPGEALVEVAYAGLCGSDVGIYEFENAYEEMAFPRVIGHEYAGTVVASGEGVDLSPGERVVERPIRSCGACFQCHTGSPNVCREATITGVHHDGAYAPFVAVPADGLQRVPDGLDLRTAALAEPTSVATRAVIHNSRISPDDRILVQGPGPIGLLAATIARRAGGEVWVSGVAGDAEHRLPVAADLGFETANVDETPVPEVVAAATDRGGFDVVIDATGRPSGPVGALQAVRGGGQIVLAGLAGDVEFDATALVRGEIDVQATYASTYEDIERALGLLRDAIDVEPLVDERFSLREGEAAFEAAIDGATVKPVFDLDELR